MKEIFLSIDKKSPFKNEPKIIFETPEFEDLFKRKFVSKNTENEKYYSIISLIDIIEKNNFNNLLILKNLTALNNEYNNFSLYVKKHLNDLAKSNLTYLYYSSVSIIQNAKNTKDKDLKKQFIEIVKLHYMLTKYAKDFDINHAFCFDKEQKEIIEKISESNVSRKIFDKYIQFAFNSIEKLKPKYNQKKDYSMKQLLVKNIKEIVYKELINSK